MLKLLNYFIPLISFLGLIFGVFLKWIAHEEIKLGRIYFVWFKRIILLLLILILLLNVKLSFNYLMFLFVGVVLGYLISRYLIDYIYLGLVCALCFLFSLELFFLINVLVFLYGLPRGSLFKRFSDVYFNFLFFIPLILMFFVSSFSVNLIALLFGISCGGFLEKIFRRSFISL